jgi:hypothetical protein
LKKEFTPEDLAHIRATYQTYGTNLRWMLRHLASGVIVGLAMPIVLGYVLPRVVTLLGMPTDVGVVEPNLALAVGFIYGGALPSLNYKGPFLSFGAFLVAPIAVAKEFGKRIAAIAAGRRALKERFADYY